MTVIRSEMRAACRVWYLDVPDKGHTWNEYVRVLWAGGDVAFFIDGYAIVEEQALARIASALDANPEAWAASGTPSVISPAARKQPAMFPASQPPCIATWKRSTQGDLLA